MISRLTDLTASATQVPIGPSYVRSILYRVGPPATKWNELKESIILKTCEMPSIPIIIVIQFNEFRFLSLCALHFVPPYFALGALDAYHTMRRGDVIKMNP
jgi:hypothetical protein